jgi:hypothetical protein
MRRLTIPALLSLLLLPVACTPRGGTGQQPREPEPEQQPPPRGTQFGTIGPAKIGEFEGQIPFYQDGDLMVYFLLSGHPGKPLGLACALVAKLTPGDRTLFDGGVGCSSDSLQLAPAQLDGKGRTFRFLYRVSGRPPVEQCSAGGKDYKPEAGRVFLLDLSADPPGVAQVQTDLTDVLAARPGGSPPEAELKAAVEKLAEKDKAIRDFQVNARKR